MKFYLFRCKARRQLLAATRYETGSNLPSEQCIGGWEFVEPLHLTGSKLPKHTVDVTKLRRAVQQNGLFVWEEKSAPATVAAMAPPPPPLATVVELPPVSVPGVDVPLVPIALAPAPSERVLIPLPVSVAPTPPLPVAPPPPPARPFAPPPAPVSDPSPPPAKPDAPPPPAEIAAPPPPRPAPAAAPPPSPRPTPAPPKPAMAPATPPPRPAYVPLTPASKPVPVAVSAPPVQPAATPPAAHPSSARKPAHQVVWFDIPVRDLERAVRFYSAVLGAPVEMVQAAFGTPTIALLPHPEGAVTGSLVATNDANVAEGGPLVYLTAEGRLDEAVAAAQMNGGKVVQGKQSFGSAGWRAIVLDSEGNRIALHST